MLIYEIMSVCVLRVCSVVYMSVLMSVCCGVCFTVFKYISIVIVLIVCLWKRVNVWFVFVCF